MGAQKNFYSTDNEGDLQYFSYSYLSLFAIASRVLCLHLQLRLEIGIFIFAYLLRRQTSGRLYNSGDSASAGHALPMPI